MTSNAVNFQGRLSASSKRAWHVRCCGWLALFLGTLFATNALADNVLQDIAYAPLPGGQVQVTLKFAGPVADTPYGRFASFSDPDGNGWVLRGELTSS